jgi:hypothetical protein
MVKVLANATGAPSGESGLKGCIHTCASGLVEALPAVAFPPPGHPIGTQRKTNCPSLVVSLVA